MTRIDVPVQVDSPVTLHDVKGDRAMVGVRVLCPVTEDLVTVALTPNQQRALLHGLQAHFDRQPTRLVVECGDCDPTPAPCICEIAEPLIGRAHTASEMTYFQQLDDAMNGRR